MPDAFWQASKHFHKDIPPAVLDLHAREGVFKGTCDITCGTGWIAALLLKLGGFPNAGQDVPVTLSTTHAEDAAMWVRNFGGHQTRSRIVLTDNGLIAEKFGPFTLAMRPELRGDALALPVAGFKVLGIPVPAFLWPRSETTETSDSDGCYVFDVSASMPIIGPLIRYQGYLRRET